MKIVVQYLDDRSLIATTLHTKVILEQNVEVEQKIARKNIQSKIME